MSPLIPVTMSNYKERLSEKEQFEYEYYLRVLNEIATQNLEDVKICIEDGFYTLFAEDAKKAGYDILNVSKAYFDRSYDVFLKKRPKETNSWEQVRIQAAIAAMQGICASPVNVARNEISLAEASVKIAEKLVEALKNINRKEEPL